MPTLLSLQECLGVQARSHKKNMYMPSALIPVAITEPSPSTWSDDQQRSIWIQDVVCIRNGQLIYEAIQ